MSLINNGNYIALPEQKLQYCNMLVNACLDNNLSAAMGIVDAIQDKKLVQDFINTELYGYNTTLFLLACARCNLGVIEFLIRNGGDPLLSDELGYNPITTALISMNTDAIVALRDYYKYYGQDETMSPKYFVQNLGINPYFVHLLLDEDPMIFVDFYAVDKCGGDSDLEIFWSFTKEGGCPPITGGWCFPAGEITECGDN